MGFVAWTIELLVGSPAERNVTRAPAESVAQGGSC